MIGVIIVGGLIVLGILVLNAGGAITFPWQRGKRG